MPHPPSFSTLLLIMTSALAFRAAETHASPPPSEAARIDALLSRYAEIGLFNGVALVARDGAPVLAKGDH